MFHDAISLKWIKVVLNFIILLKIVTYIYNIVKKNWKKKWSLKHWNKCGLRNSSAIMIPDVVMLAFNQLSCCRIMVLLCYYFRWCPEEGPQAVRLGFTDGFIHQHCGRGDCLSVTNTPCQRVLELPHQPLHHQPTRQHRRHDGGEGLSITGIDMYIHISKAEALN